MSEQEITQPTAFDLFLSGNKFVKSNETGNIRVKESVFQDIMSFGYIMNKFHGNVEFSLYMLGFQHDGVLYVVDYIFPAQENNGAFSKIGDDGLKDYVLQTMTKQDEFKANYDKNIFVLGQWHSHNTMQAFFSATDDGHIKEFCDTVKDNKLPQCFFVFSFKDSEFSKFDEFKMITEPVKIEYKIAIFSRLEFTDNFVGKKYDYNFTYKVQPGPVERFDELKKLVDEKHKPYTYTAPPTTTTPKKPTYNYNDDDEYYSNHGYYGVWYNNYAKEREKAEKTAVIDSKYLTERLNKFISTRLTKKDVIRWNLGVPVIDSEKNISNRLFPVQSNQWFDMNKTKKLIQTFMHFVFHTFDLYDIRTIMNEYEFYTESLTPLTLKLLITPLRIIYENKRVGINGCDVDALEFIKKAYDTYVLQTKEVFYTQKEVDNLIKEAVENERQRMLTEFNDELYGDDDDYFKGECPQCIVDDCPCGADCNSGGCQCGCTLPGGCQL